MPSSNNAYSVLNHLDNNGHLQIPETIIEHKCHSSSDNWYYLIHLPMKSNIIIDGYSVENHHASCNAKADGWLASKSQYHYTAFLSKNGQLYRLQVNFKSKSKILRHPYLYEVRGLNDEILVACEELNLDFSLLAQFYMSEFIEYLRAKQQSLIDKIQIDYLPVERLATSLSNDIEKNKKVYLLTLDRSIELWEQIRVFTANRRTIGTLAYLKNLKASVETIVEDKKSEPTPVKDLPRSQALALKFFEEDMTAELEQKPYLATNLQPLLVEFEQIKRLKTSKANPYLSDLFSKLIVLEIEVGVSTYQLSTKSLMDLQKFKLKTIDFAKAQFETLVEKSAFSEALNLSCFFSFFPEEAIFSLLN